MKNRIETERTLIVGNAKMSEGDWAYVKYCVLSDCGKGRWMYAKCIRLEDNVAVFATESEGRIVLLPEKIVQICDKCPDDALLMDRLRMHEGEIIECEI